MMERKRKLSLAKAAVVLGAIPLILWAYEYGPDPGYCGVPNEPNGSGSPTLICLNSGCHVGTLNATGGGIKVTFPNGATYTPGVTQQLTVTISDASAGPRAWGFQLTARPASDTTAMAGSFLPTDMYTQVMCSQPNLVIFGAVCLPGANGGDPDYCAPSSTPACSADKTLQYAEHSYAGYLNNRVLSGSASYKFNWTPPATNVGNITIYVAANSGPPTTPPTQDNADIYTATFTLTPAAASTAPTISANGVVSGASFQPGIVPGSWITIQGANFTPANFTDTWANAIVNGKLPTALDGVSVSVGGQLAYIEYVSATQINAVAPNIGTGSTTVTVTTASNVTSAAATATSSTVQPAFFLFGGQYAVATHLDGSLALQNGVIAGLTTVPAQPGEYVVLWGTGFGPTSPAVPAGEETPSDQIYSTANTVSVAVNGTPATVYGSVASLAPGFAGLYQLAVQIPANAPNGDFPIVAAINGAQSPASVLITVHN